MNFFIMNPNLKQKQKIFLAGEWRGGGGGGGGRVVSEFFSQSRNLKNKK